jgi:membrane-associated protein
LFGVAYTLLLFLSILVIVPRYLHASLVGFLLAIITDTEPEGRFLTSFYSPLVWTLIPLTSMGLCLTAWIAYNASNGVLGPRRRIAELGFVLSFVASFLPAILVVRELLLYSALGVTAPDSLRTLTNFASLVKAVVNPASLLGRGGIWVVPVVVFLETGLFFGFFLPGDSLLLTVGVLGAFGQVDLSLLIPLSIAGAIIGDQLGYATGHRLGAALSYRYQFVDQNIGRASEFYAKYGGKAIVLARFVPVVRTFAPIVAGAARMGYSKFSVFNIVGGILWVVGVTSAGYLIGSHAPVVAGYLDPLILAVIITSPLVWMLTWIWGRRRG